MLGTAEPAAKAALSHQIAAAWRRGALTEIGQARPPDRPARPSRPPLLAPKDMPRRRGGSTGARIALLHAVAHIELNAIDLAWDLIARFTDAELPSAFYDDWVTVADEEAKHFGLLAARLGELGAAYGDLPAHDGLWQAAEATAGDLLARLAVVPLSLEARGLDVTPAMVARLQRADDHASAVVLGIIYADEISHVAAGRRWFEWLCAERRVPPAAAFHQAVRCYLKAGLKAPFNRAGRDAAGLPEEFYLPLAPEP